MSAGSPTSDIAAEVSERPDVPLSDIGECLKEENFYSLKEGQAKILGFLLLPRTAGYAAFRPPVWWRNGNVRLGWSGGLRIHRRPPVADTS